MGERKKRKVMAVWTAMAFGFSATLVYAGEKAAEEMSCTMQSSQSGVKTTEVAPSTEEQEKSGTVSGSVEGKAPVSAPKSTK